MAESTVDEKGAVNRSESLIRSQTPADSHFGRREWFDVQSEKRLKSSRSTVDNRGQTRMWVCVPQS
jgi:hypothetical protein